MTKRWRIHLLITSVAVTMLAPLHDLAAQSAPAYQPFPASWQARLDKFTAGVESAKTPAVSMIVDSPRWGTMYGSSGYADIEKKIKPDPTMHFRIGSLTKMFTAQTLLSCEQDGLVRMTDTLDKFLKIQGLEFDPAYHAEKITVAECLQMTSGLGSYLDAKYFETVPYQVAPTIDQVPRLLVEQNNTLPKTQPFNPLYEAGTFYPSPFAMYSNLYTGQASKITLEDTKNYPPKYQWWYYSNSSYMSVGIIIEAVTGKKLADAMQERVIDKLGLKNTFFATDSSLREPMMRGYSKLNAQMQPYDPAKKDWIDRTVIDPSYAWAAGSVMSTPEDIIAFLKGIFKTEKVLNNATKEKWFTFVSADFIWPNMDYGRGALMQDEQPFGQLRGHGGSIPGFNNLAYYMPDHDTFFVIVVNTWDSHNEVAVMEAIMPLVGNAASAVYPSQEMKFLSPNSMNIRFKWQPGRVYGDSYNLYLGTDRTAVANATTPTQTSYTNSADVLNIPAGTHYWRVDTVSEKKGTVTGAVWKFTILSKLPTSGGGLVPSAK